MMEKITDCEAQFRQQMRKIYSANSQLIGALLLMRDKASNPDLLNALINHQKKKKDQRNQLEAIGKILNISFTNCHCKLVKKMIDKAISIITDNMKPDEKDFELIADVQHIYQYEISVYKTAIKFAEALNLISATKKLEEFIKQEETANSEFSFIAQKINNLKTSKPFRFAT